MLNLRSKLRQRLLAYYFTNPTARLHLRDLAQRLDIDPSNLSKELRRLEREGLFRSEVSGRQKYFQLNHDYPLFEEVRKIVNKTIGAAPLISRLLKKIGGIDEAYLYGSFARNQQDAASDIDVLVIGTPHEAALAQAVSKLERQLGREINYTVLSPKELKSRRTRKDAFLENVWDNRIVPLVVTDEEIKGAAVDWAQIERFLASADKKLASAQKILVFDEEACLQQAHEAMLKASLGFMFSHGFRARSQPGHHIAIIEFVRSRIGRKHAGLLIVFDRLRRKRNVALYDDTGFVSQRDAENALESCGSYLSVIRSDIAARKP
jgi:predicted nucleotidyltransferase